MKERIKEAFKGVTINLVFAWVFVAMFVYVIIECICESSYVGVIVALPLLFIAMQAFELHKIGKELKEAKRFAVNVSLALAGLCVLKEAELYKELYGELPEEEAKEEIKEKQP